MFLTSRIYFNSMKLILKFKGQHLQPNPVIHVCDLKSFLFTQVFAELQIQMLFRNEHTDFEAQNDLLLLKGMVLLLLEEKW